MKKLLSLFAVLGGLLIAAPSFAQIAVTRVTLTPYGGETSIASSGTKSYGIKFNVKYPVYVTGVSMVRLTGDSVFHTWRITKLDGTVLLQNAVGPSLTTSWVGGAITLLQPGQDYVFSMSYTSGSTTVPKHNGITPLPYSSPSGAFTVVTGLYENSSVLVPTIPTTTVYGFDLFAYPALFGVYQ